MNKKIMIMNCLSKKNHLQLEVINLMNKKINSLISDREMTQFYKKWINTLQSGEISRHEIKNTDKNN